MILWLFEFGYVLQHIATIFQIKRIKEKRTTELISLDTNLFFLIGSICRVIWMWDSMLANFTFAYLEIIVAFSSLSYLVYLYNQFKDYDFIAAETRLPKYLSFPVLLSVILILSFLFHPGNKNAYYLSLQMLVSINIYSECIGLLPQLYVIMNTKETGILSDFYIIFMAAARFFRIFFWIKMWLDGNSFFSLILADVIHTIFLSAVIYGFKKNLRKIMMPVANTESTNKKMF